ncbi:MAG TPA: pyridoxamine 5'-phosphate oxidase family protein [bacterium]
MADAKIPASVHDLFGGKALAHLAVVTPTGFPNSSPVWIDREGDMVLVNSEAKRVKSQSMEVGSKVAISIVDPTNPFRYVGVQGVVVERRTKGAKEHIDALSARYTGKTPYPWIKPGDERVVFVIKPVRVKAPQ